MINLANTLKALHDAPEILRLVNVWDCVTTAVVASHPETKAIATAGHSIAASHGYPDGQHIPFDLLVAALERIVSATTLPVSADLDAGFGGDPEDLGRVRENVRRVIGAGVVGLNVEDRMDPIDAAKARMSAVLAGAADEGVELVLNARTDAVLKPGSLTTDQATDTAIERGQAFLALGATCVFVPGVLDAERTKTLVAGIGTRKVSVIGLPGALTAAQYETLGVARISYGPTTQNVALTTLKRLTESLYADGVIPSDTEKLNS
jgi:2-methylisocitrate lyase-like PEP mutase family enzyme